MKKIFMLAVFAIGIMLHPGAMASLPSPGEKNAEKWVKKTALEIMTKKKDDPSYDPKEIAILLNDANKSDQIILMQKYYRKDMVNLMNPLNPAGFFAKDLFLYIRNNSLAKAAATPPAPGAP